MKHRRHKHKNSKISRHKLFVALIIFFVFASVIISAYFTLYPLSPSAKNNPAAVSGKFFELQSFRGVLANTLGSIGEKAQQFQQQIETVTRNPFADASSAVAEVPIAPKSFSFAILGDTQRFKAGDANGNFQKAMASVRKLNPDMVFAVGDLVGSCDSYSKCEHDYTNWKNIVGSLMPKTYAVQGNHDRTGGSKADKIWQSEFSLPTNGPADYSEITYSFDFQNSHFVVLASDDPIMHKINEQQRAWLEKDLAANKKDNTFVFFHEPSFPVSSKVGESLDKHPSDRDALWQIFDKYNVTAVFNGHEHIYSRQLIDQDEFPAEKNKIYQFIIGNTDAYEKENVAISSNVDYYHKGHDFCIVEVNGKQITVKLYSVDGNLVDSFTFSK